LLSTRYKLFWHCRQIIKKQLIKQTPWNDLVVLNYNQLKIPNTELHILSTDITSSCLILISSMADYIVHNFVARMLSINVNNNNNRAIQFYSKLTTFNRTENSLARSLFIKIMLLFIMCYILSINNIILVKMHMFAKTSIVFHMIFSFRGYVIKIKKRHYMNDNYRLQHLIEINTKLIGTHCTRKRKHLQSTSI